MLKKYLLNEYLLCASTMLGNSNTESSCLKELFTVTMRKKQRVKNLPKISLIPKGELRQYW